MHACPHCEADCDCDPGNGSNAECLHLCIQFADEHEELLVARLRAFAAAYQRDADDDIEDRREMCALMLTAADVLDARLRELEKR